MDKLEQMNVILNRMDIDNRIKPLIKLYFVGKLKLNLIEENELEEQIKILCEKVENVEFVSGDIVTAYMPKANVLTVNKKLLIDGKADEVILPVFMKFEQVMNSENRRPFSNHIEDFLQACKIAKACSAPISDRLYSIYEFVKNKFEKIADNVDELKEDDGWRYTCSDQNKALNQCIIQGKNDATVLEEMAGLQKYYYHIRNEVPPQDEHEEYQGDIKISQLLAKTTRLLVRNITDDYITKKVTKLTSSKIGWEDRFKKLLFPFFKRSQKVFNWDIDEFQERINQIHIYIDRICWKDLGIDMAGNAGKNEIILNSRMFKDNEDKHLHALYLVLFHELGHEIDKSIREGIKIRDVLQPYAFDNRYYEYTNAVFETLIGTEKMYKSNKLCVDIHGYEELSPLGSMFACALGIPEIEFARIKDKGKEYEREFLEKKFPNEKDQETIAKIKMLFNKFQIISDAHYGVKMDRKINQQILDDLYKECIYLLESRIAMETQNNDKIDDNYKKWQKYYLKKINLNYLFASKESGKKRFHMPIVHDIGFCNDRISKRDFKAMLNQQSALSDFGFKDSELSDSNMPTVANRRKRLLETLRVPFIRRKNSGSKGIEQQLDGRDNLEK